MQSPWGYGFLSRFFYVIDLKQIAEAGFEPATGCFSARLDIGQAPDRLPTI